MDTTNSDMKKCISRRDTSGSTIWCPDNTGFLHVWCPGFPDRISEGMSGVSVYK